ncbi:MAG TPA: four helix bundle protein [Sphingobacteriaceae bacterium]|nr:four helix bundle protein [Sphingobacteriaceae bacterium]
MHNFKELKVWQASMEISKAVFVATRLFPQDEKFTLTSQMMRSAISIPSNIAEGCGRKSNKEFYQYLNISLGSSFELETQLILAKDFNYINEANFKLLQSQLIDVQRMITGLQKSLNT